MKLIMKLYTSLNAGYKEERELSYKTRDAIYKEEITGSCVFLLQKIVFLHDNQYLIKQGETPGSWNNERFMKEKENEMYSGSIYEHHETVAVTGTRDEGYFIGENEIKDHYIVYGVCCVSPSLRPYIQDKWDELMKEREFVVPRKETPVFAIVVPRYYNCWETLFDLGFDYDEYSNAFKKVEVDELKRLFDERMAIEIGKDYKKTITMDALEELYQDFASENGIDEWDGEKLVKNCLARKYHEVDGIFTSRDEAEQYRIDHSHHYPDGCKIKSLPCKGILAEIVETVREENDGEILIAS
jgi:hypothetical protein